ncbi:MAG TPA: hypothetical protein VGK19_17245 [Capsulimonadaceae bacterium]|jgi:hypothetical protein
MKIKLMVCIFAIALAAIALIACPNANAGLWQYSVPVDSIVSGEIHDHPSAYLWIPPKCKHVRAVIVAQHNLLEESVLLNPRFRDEMAKLDIAEVWTMPPFDFVFDWHKGAGEAFDAMMKSLADTSGYDELATAPVVPLGHSAAASYPWNFAAWSPTRTLAVISLHGDTPRSNMTGSGRPNPDWGSNNIDGVPGLFVMGQYEWIDKRTQPGLDYVAQHPGTPLAMLPDIGHGHFDTSDEQVTFLALFLRKAVQFRLPASAPVDKAAALKAVDPTQGWLVDRWSPQTGRRFPSAPYGAYAGDRQNAFWCFDREMAMATERYGAGRVLSDGRSIVYIQGGRVLGTSAGAAGGMPRPKLEMEADGRTFHFSAFAVDGVVAPGTEWTDAEAKSVNAKPLRPRVLCGPIAKAGNDTYRLEFDQSGFKSAYRSYNVFISTMIPANEQAMVKSQPAGIFVRRNTDGADNIITFQPISDTSSQKPFKLIATASSGLPVAYYVDSGPAVVDGDTLKFTSIPARSKYPVVVKVVAWQWGRSSAPAVNSAEPVTVTFYIRK